MTLEQESEAIEPGIALADVESSLALFAEGIAGRYLHIRSNQEFAANPKLTLEESVGQNSDTLFLPESVATTHASTYRVLAMEQIGLRECDTLSFRMETAVEQIPSLLERFQPDPNAGPRAGDYRLLFTSFSQPALAEDLFLLFEETRIQAHLQRAYPGLTKHLQAYHGSLLASEIPADLLEQAKRWRMGEPLMLSGPELQRTLYKAIVEHCESAATVYDSVAALCGHYEGVLAHYELVESSYRETDESLVDWLNREQRVEEWEEELEDINEQLSQSMAMEIPTGQEEEAVYGDAGDGSQRQIDLDIKELKDERDTLKRRVDMERSAVAHALGKSQGDARSFRYDEWDYLNRTYLRAWCRVFEQRLGTDGEEDIAPLKAVIRAYRNTVQRQLEQIRPTGLERIRRVQDGDELDLNTVIEARLDIRAGQSANERVYSRKERVQRDVSAIFLVDLSASTDDPIHPPEPRDWSNYEEDESDTRAGWYASFDEIEEEPEEPGRKIIDLEREAMVVMAAALEALGDSYGIYGFSGYSKDNVELFIAKEPDDAFSHTTLKNIAAMAPKGSTRMGPAIRHATQKLMNTGSAMKVLMVISDGFPQDCDYGPVRGNHDYGVEDTAKALQECQQKGIETFCMTVDKSGHDYLKRMCRDERYMIIEEMEDLPSQLTKVYAALTGK
ncbi:MAG: VWA domain-containing protein [Pseudomonadota bacterium]|nr:VWA domain-containing protein [Pseudomonadota bacterium]